MEDKSANILKVVFSVQKYIKWSFRYRKIQKVFYVAQFVRRYQGIMYNIITHFLITILFLRLQSVETLWLNALWRQNSTQDSEVQGLNPDQTCFLKKIFWSKGPNPGLGSWREQSERFAFPPGPVDRTLLSQHLMAWTVNSPCPLPGHEPSTLKSTVTKATP